MKKKIWDLYAPIYEKAMRADYKYYKFMYDRIPTKIQNKEVLELATGPGLLAKHVAYAAKRMVATDYSEGMIREAQKGKCGDNLLFEVADATDLPYDVMPEPEKALKEIERVLKEDGLLIAPNFVSHQSGIISRLWSGILRIAGITFEHQWSGEEYLSWLGQNGWKVQYKKSCPARITLMYVECIREK